MMAQTQHFELRGWHVLAGLLGFFALIIAVNVGFAVVAVRSFPGEDVRRSYLQGLAYNDTLDERRAQAALGWRAYAQLRAAGEGAELAVRVTTREGAGLDALALEGALRWPADARRDRELLFSPRGDGLYVADLGALAPGHWRLRARANGQAEQALEFEADLLWPTAP